LTATKTLDVLLIVQLLLEKSFGSKRKSKTTGIPMTTNLGNLGT